MKMKKFVVTSARVEMDDKRSAMCVSRRDLIEGSPVLAPMYLKLSTVQWKSGWGLGRACGLSLAVEGCRVIVRRLRRNATN